MSTRAPRATMEFAQERAIATIAQPTTLGLFAFATGTWIGGTVIAGVFPAQALAGVAPLLLVYTGIAQFIAGLYAYRRANNLAASAFCTFGAFNAATAMLAVMQALHMVPMTGYPVVIQGFFIESFAFIALALTIAALPSNPVVVTVLALVAVGDALAGIPFIANALGQEGWGLVGSIGGWLLVASSFFAYYLGTALLLNGMWNRVVLPLWGEP